MTGTLAHNGFGPNLPLTDVEDTCRRLGILPTDSVLEVGGAGNPFPRANVVCDLTFGSCAQRNGAPGVFREDVRYVEAPAESLPFQDGAFDFVYCTQVLEHVLDPEAAARELSRVARRGFVEVPSRMGELVCGNPTHRWIIDREGSVLVFHARPFVAHPLDNFFYGVWFRDPELRRLADETYRNLFNHQVPFEGRIECRIAPTTGTRFDYDDPEQAGRAHYSFARNVLRAGADPAYAYPDAVEARRLLRPSLEATLLLATYQARLLRFDDALATLHGLTSVRAEALSRLITRLARGESQDVTTLPLPSRDPGPAGGPDTAPLVSLVVVGEDPAALAQVVEACLTQDYPAVEVVVSARGDVNQAMERLTMGSRLQVLSHPTDAPLGVLLNRGWLATRGELAGFVLEGERPFAHHVERLAGQLLVGGGDGVHGDRVLLSSGHVVGPDLVPDDPSAAGVSLSTFLWRRRFLERLGGIKDSDGEEKLLPWLLRAAREGRVDHVREVTIKSTRAMPAGAEMLDRTLAAARLRPLELLRDLMAATVREEGLRQRLRTLEASGGTSTEPPRA